MTNLSPASGPSVVAGRARGRARCAGLLIAAQVRNEAPRVHTTQGALRVETVVALQAQQEVLKGGSPAHGSAAEQGAAGSGVLVTT